MNRKLRNVLTFVAACLVLVWCIPSVGQVLKGSISGTVVDPQGAVISNAQVKATNLATGATLSTTSDSSGLFRFSLIPAGEYKVEVSAQGFKTTAQSNVAVIAGRDTGVGTVKLTVGATSETVEVTAAAPLIETSQAQVTNTFSGTALNTFAGLQENQGLDNLALFVPGVSSVRDNAFSNTNGGQGFSVNGLRGRNNDQQIDGQNNNDNSVAGPGLFVTDPEFVNQYVLITNQFGPEYGRNSGSVVNIITKSGSNAWHGSIFATENNSVMNSLNNFDKNPDICGKGADSTCLKEPNRSNDEFGGFTIGGPFVKNKAFFFGGFDQEIVSQKNTFRSSLLTPTPSGLAAIAACGGDPAALAAISKFGPYGISGGNPVPLGDIQHPMGSCPTADFAGVSRTVAQPVHIFDWILRSDLQLGSDTITGRYIFNRNNSFNLNDNGPAGYFFNVPALAQSLLFSWTRNLSARMVNEARASFGRLNVEFGGTTLGTEPTANNLDQALANISFRDPTLLGFGPATNLPQQRIVNTYQLQDNWNYVVGKHTFKAGVNWTYQRSPNIFLPNINGQYRYDSWDTFFGCASGDSPCTAGFGPNIPDRIRIANGPSLLDFREYDTFVYGGDDWKIGKNLTVNLGLTWSYYGQPANLFNDITVPRESNPATAFWASTEPAVKDSLRNTFSNPGASIPLSIRTEPTIPAPKNSFGPALGFAYTPQFGGFLTGNGKTTIRGGYRYLYDPPYYNIYLNISTSAPMTFLNTVPGPGGHPLPAVPTGPNVRADLASSIQLGAFDPREFAQTHITPNFGPDKVHSWSLGVEREITKNSAIEARYVGNHAYSLFQTIDANPFIRDLATDFPNLVPAGLTPCPSANALFHNGSLQPVDPVGRLDCNDGVARTRSNSGFSNYHSAQVEFRANNLFKQLTLRSSYTFSKTLDNVSEIFSTFGGGNTVFFAQNPAQQVKGAGEYSFSGLDYPHQFSFLVTEQLPFFKGQHGFAGHLLGGWSLSGNYIIASGQRYSPVSAFVANFTEDTAPVLVNALCPILGCDPNATHGFSTPKDYFDLGYINNFTGIDTAHPFFGSKTAPANTVGIFAMDACDAFFTDANGLPSGFVPGGNGIAMCDSTNPNTSPTTLVSLNAINSPNTDLTTAVPAVNKNQVRYIMNGAEASKVFGTPFGNVPRNPAQDAISNIANVSVYKNIKFTERMSFDFHATLQNAFNHSNFSSVDPFLDDAGLHGAFTGFADPTQTPSVTDFAIVPTRRIFVGGTFRF